MSRWEVARRLAAMLRPMAPNMTLSVVCRIVNHTLGAVIPVVAVAGVTRVSIGGGAVGPLTALLVALALTKGTFRYLEQLTGHAVAFRLLSRLRVDTYRRLVPLPTVALDDERSGDLVARAVGDVDRVEPFFAHTIAPVAGAIVVPLLVFTGLALWVDPSVALAFLPFPLLIAIAAPMISAKRVAAASSASRDAEGETAAFFTEAVQGRRELRLFDAGDRALERLRARGEELAAWRRLLARGAAVRWFIGDLLSGATVLVVALVAVARWQAEVIGLPALGAALMAAWAGTAPARALENVVPDLEQALAAAERLFRLGDSPSSEGSPPPAATLPSDPLSLSFEGVTVRLAGSAVIEGFDADVEPGSLTAVVGPSGSGKSTLVGLLLRLRDPDEGSVLIGGVDIGSVQPAEVRERVALVPQRPDFFWGSLRHNLVIARPEADDAAVWEALGRVGLDDWAASLVSGLDTTIGELGETMSGGQRQRLAVARALLRDPSVLVLDEATSELDPVNEATVMQAIRQERGRRTIVVVAHRIDTVTDADKILVVDRGHLVESGTHEELAAGAGVYAGLWSRHLDVMV